jgi:hypothetical protein
LRRQTFKIHFQKELPATADNRVLDAKAQRLRSSQALETLSESLAKKTIAEKKY